MEHTEEVVVKEEVLVDDSYKCQFCEDYSVQSYVKLRTHMKTHANQKVASHCSAVVHMSITL